MIVDVFLNGVAMMIAICLVVVMSVFVFWVVAQIVRWVWRPEFFGPFLLVPLMAMVDEMLGLFSSPDVPIATWCQGCDELVSPKRMAFTDGWRYRCDDCRRPHRQFVMDVSSVEDVKAGREVLAVHNGGQVSVIRTALPERTAARCDVCERSAPPWKTGSYRCVECRGQFPNERRYRLPDTAAEYMEEQRRRAHEAAERRRADEYRRRLETEMRAPIAREIAREAREVHRRWVETQKRWVDLGSDDRR